MKNKLLILGLMFLANAVNAQLLPPTKEKAAVPGKYTLSINNGAPTVKTRKVLLANPSSRNFADATVATIALKIPLRKPNI